MSPKCAARYVQQIVQGHPLRPYDGRPASRLKPSNILIDANDHVHVTDFGLAKQLDAYARLTVSGQLLDTASYMPPEQVSGHRVIGPAGCLLTWRILYELLTGRPPFCAGEHLDNAPSRLAKHNPVLRGDLPTSSAYPGDDLPQMPEKNPGNRYGTAAELARNLGPLPRPQPVSVSSVSLLERLALVLSRGQHDAEFQAWASMLPISRRDHLFLNHLTVFLLPYAGLGDAIWPLVAARVAEFAAMRVSWFHRRAWFPTPRRGGAATLGPVACLRRRLGRVVRRASAGSLPCHLAGRQYLSRLAVLGSLGFFMMGSSYWGYCYLYGVVFLAVGLVMPFCIGFAPLLFGVTWAACLVALGRHARRIREES